MKNKHILIPLLLISIVGIIYYFKDSIVKIFKHEDATASTDVATETGMTAPAQETSVAITNFWNLDKNKVLSVGSKGAEVKKLQEMINNANSLLKQPAIKVDGIFGNGTLKALQYLVTKNSITLSEASLLLFNAITNK